jgi:hypothetical protein
MHKVLKEELLENCSGSNETRHKLHMGSHWKEVKGPDLIYFISLS